MPRINDISSPKARELAQYIGSKYGNGNAVLSSAEAGRALKALASDPALAAKMKDVFGAASPTAAKALINALFKGGEPGPVPGGAVSVGTRPGGPGSITLQPNGNFAVGTAASSPDPIKSAGVLYEGALLVAAGINPYASATPEVRARAFGVLSQSASIGAERSIREMQPSEATMQLKSGSATLLLELARASKTPGEAPLRSRAIDTYLNLAEKEIHRGLRTSMVMNFDSSKGDLTLSPAQSTKLSALLAEVLPSKPPYEEWFKGGNATINIKHYVHSDYWDLMPTAYQQHGFKQTALPGGKILWEGTVKDPNGKAPDTKFRIEVSKVADYSTDRTMLQDMNDPNTQIEVYTGHSNLGGNIAAALKAAPQTEVGTKLTYLWMCRGKQNIADFTNRFPKSHLVTTDVPPDGYSMVPMMNALLDTVAKRGDYKAWATQGDRPGYHMFPTDRRLYDHRDLDRDGKLDGSGDRVFDIYPRAARGKKIDLKPGPSQDPAKLDGTALVNALGFANTLLTYHVDKGDGLSPIKASYGDHFTSEGYYQSAGNELVRITPSQRNGETFYSVAVNSKYANQSEETLGMAMLYEMSKFATQRERGSSPLTVEDKMRNLLLSSEYLAYMTGQGQESGEIVRSVMQFNGWPTTFGLDQLMAALEKDGHGYASMDAVNALKAIVGPQVGDGRGIK